MMLVSLSAKRSYYIVGHALRWLNYLLDIRTRYNPGNHVVMNTSHGMKWYFGWSSEMERLAINVLS